MSLAEKILLIDSIYDEIGQELKERKELYANAKSTVQEGTVLYANALAKERAYDDAIDILERCKKNKLCESIKPYAMDNVG